MGGIMGPVYSSLAGESKSRDTSSAIYIERSKIESFALDRDFCVKLVLP